MHLGWKIATDAQTVHAFPICPRCHRNAIYGVVGSSFSGLLPGANFLSRMLQSWQCCNICTTLCFASLDSTKDNWQIFAAEYTPPRRISEAQALAQLISLEQIHSECNDFYFTSSTSFLQRFDCGPLDYTRLHLVKMTLPRLSLLRISSPNC